MIREVEYFLHLCLSRRLCGQCVGNPEIKRGIFVWVKEKTRKKLWQ